MKSQYARVLAVLESAANPLSLFEIKDAILARFKLTDSEAAISARIRDIRHNSVTGTVNSLRQPGKSWFRYWVKSNNSGHFCLT